MSEMLASATEAINEAVENVAAASAEQKSLPETNDPELERTRRIHRFNPGSEYYLFSGLHEIEPSVLRTYISTLQKLVDPKSNLNRGLEEASKQGNDLPLLLEEETIEEFAKTAKELGSNVIRLRLEKAREALSNLRPEELELAIESLAQLQIGSEENQFVIQGLSPDRIKYYKNELAQARAEGGNQYFVESAFTGAYSEAIAPIIWEQISRSFDTNGSAQRIYKHHNLDKERHSLADIIGAQSQSLGRAIHNVHYSDSLFDVSKVDLETGRLLDQSHRLDDLVSRLRGELDADFIKSNVTQLINAYLQGPECGFWTINPFQDQRVTHRQNIDVLAKRVERQIQLVNNEAYGGNVELSDVIDINTDEFRNLIESGAPDEKWFYDLTPDGKFIHPHGQILERWDSWSPYFNQHRNVPEIIRNLAIEADELTLEDGLLWSEEQYEAKPGEANGGWKDPLVYHLEALGSGTEGKEQAIETVQHAFGKAGGLAAAILDKTDNAEFSIQDQKEIVEAIKFLSSDSRLNLFSPEEVIASLAVYDRFLSRYSTSGLEFSEDISAGFRAGDNADQRKETALALLEDFYRKQEKHNLHSKYIRPVEEGIQYINTKQIPRLETLPESVDGHGKYHYATDEVIRGMGRVIDLYNTTKSETISLLESAENILTFNPEPLLETSLENLEGSSISNQSKETLEEYVVERIAELQQFSNRLAETIHVLETLDQFGSEQIIQQESRIDLAQQVGWLPEHLSDLSWSRENVDTAIRSLTNKEGFFDPSLTNPHLQSFFLDGLSGFEILTGQAPYTGSNQNYAEQLPLFQQALRDAGIEAPIETEESVMNRLLFDIRTIRTEILE